MLSLALTPHELVGEFFARTKPPSQAHIDALAREGIGMPSLAADLGFGVAQIERDGARFEFCEVSGETALVLVARDLAGDPADLVAFRRRDGWIGSWCGRVALLGAENVMGPWLDTALTVHRTAMDWLRDGRRGIVLIDPARAARELRDVSTVRAADVEHGLRLEALLTPQVPNVVVAAAAHERVAA